MIIFCLSIIDLLNSHYSIQIFKFGIHQAIIICNILVCEHLIYQKSNLTQISLEGGGTSTEKKKLKERNALLVNYFRKITVLSFVCLL